MYKRQFKSIAELGSRLIQNHLLKCTSNEKTSCTVSVGCRVQKIAYENETVTIDENKSKGFDGIPSSVWEFKIGAYQPLQKWLKDRKAKGGKNPRPGRKLTHEDIEHYQKMVVAIRETIRLMGEIDEVIDQHGGWPDAFVTEPLQDSATDEDSSPPFA